MVTKSQQLHGAFFNKSVIPLYPSTVCSVLGKISHLEPKLHPFSGQRILTLAQKIDKSRCKCDSRIKTMIMDNALRTDFQSVEFSDRVEALLFAGEKVSLRN